MLHAPGGPVSGTPKKVEIPLQSKQPSEVEGDSEKSIESKHAHIGLIGKSHAATKSEKERTKEENTGKAESPAVTSLEFHTLDHQKASQAIPRRGMGTAACSGDGPSWPVAQVGEEDTGGTSSEELFQWYSGTEDCTRGTQGDK